MLNIVIEKKYTNNLYYACNITKYIMHLFSLMQKNIMTLYSIE